MTWLTFLAIVFVLSRNVDIKHFLADFKIYTDDLKELIKYNTKFPKNKQNSK